VVKPLKFTRHAATSAFEREVSIEWIEKAVFQPEWTMPDPADPDLERRYATVDDFGGRVLRVVCYENDQEVRIVTLFFDRNARRPK
jgi:uncharacterized DUF497 family protein